MTACIRTSPSQLAAPGRPAPAVVVRHRPGVVGDWEFISRYPRRAGGALEFVSDSHTPRANHTYCHIYFFAAVMKWCSWNRIVLKRRRKKIDERRRDGDLLVPPAHNVAHAVRS